MLNIENYERQKEVLQTLAKQVAEISELPLQDKTKQAWKDLNMLKTNRPMFMIDQLPWGQLNYEHELDLVCADSLLREF